METLINNIIYTLNMIPVTGEANMERMLGVFSALRTIKASGCTSESEAVNENKEDTNGR